MIVSKDKFKSIMYARNDYICNGGQEDCWLFNTNLKVKPSNAVQKGKGPYILRCCNHEHESKLLMVHPCRQPFHIIYNNHPEKLCHAVIKSKTNRPMKILAY